MTTIIDFQKVKEKAYQDAYVWAAAEQQRLRIYGAPIELNLRKGETMHGEDDCIISMFRDEKTGRTLLRRDWLDDQTLVYNPITNFAEAKRKAPEAVTQMLDNGLKLYHYFDGPHGGITRPMDHKWRFS